jgi:ubiquinone/menaquinone biosynthesis C-methylase UbiE
VAAIELPAQLKRSVERVAGEFSRIPTSGLGAHLRVQAGLAILVALEDLCYRLDDEPSVPLETAIESVAVLPKIFEATLPHVRSNDARWPVATDQPDLTAVLFETAWTQFDENTYDHSVGLVQSRLQLSGFDKNYFQGKTCFDGGCGTGRLAVAMARAGAAKVVAVDAGRASLDYLRNVSKRYQLDQIEIVHGDVTNLEGFPTDRFDFVASNGVLHHTTAPEKGLAEHLRITRPGGVFWIYLYGAEGMYWQTYDEFRFLLDGVSVRLIADILASMRIRKGLIYTYLDNLLAPRVYFRLQQVLDLLSKSADFTYRHARGLGPIDDTAALLATRWGPQIFGPDGEIRIIVQKTSKHRVLATT